MSVSGVVHLVSLVTLGLLVVEPKAISQMQEVLAQTLDEPGRNGTKSRSSWKTSSPT